MSQLCYTSPSTTVIHGIHLPQNQNKQTKSQTFSYIIHYRKKFWFRLREAFKGLLDPQQAAGCCQLPWRFDDRLQKLPQKHDSNGWIYALSN